MIHLVFHLAWSKSISQHAFSIITQEQNSSFSCCKDCVAPLICKYKTNECVSVYL